MGPWRVAGLAPQWQLTPGLGGRSPARRRRLQVSKMDKKLSWEGVILFEEFGVWGVMMVSGPPPRRRRRIVTKLRG